MRTIHLSLLCVLGLATLGACGSCDDDDIAWGPAGENGEGEPGSPEGDTDSDDGPDPLAGMRTHLDLVALAHLADIDRGGLYIDFGTPARMKSTAGRWHNDWGRDGSDDQGTYTRLGSSGNVYFQLDTAQALTARLRLRKVGTSRIVVYLNGETIRTLDLTDGVSTYEMPIPAANLRRGENKLMLRSTETREQDGAQVSAAIYSLQLAREGTSAETTPPAFAELARDQELSGASRRALVVPAGTKLSFYVEIPERAKLAFGVGASAEGAHGMVTVTPAVGEANEAFTGALPTRYRNQLVDLAAFAGEVVRVDFATEGPADATVAWATPQVVVPMPEQARLPGQARNVVMLTIDTLRASKLRPYNPRTRVRTPGLDAFAGDATLFERAQAPENWTKPSVASILTSLFPTTHNTKADGSSLPASALMVSEVFRAADFSTATFLANGYVSDRFGFAQGWDHYTNYIRENKSTEAENVFGEAATWIEAHEDERFYVYIQTIDPHVPYDPPDEFLSMYDANPTSYVGQIRNRSTGDLLGEAKHNPPRVVFTEADQQRLKDLHDAEISYHDRHFARFLDTLRELDLYDDTIFVVTSDHGEEFNEHGSWGHGHSVYQELLSVPLLVRWKAAEASGVRVGQTVSTMDIAPTVLEAAGVPIPDAFEGRSLLGYLRGQPPAGPAVAFSDFLDDRRVIRAGRWKLILRGNLTWTMFDLERDPGEEHELENGDQSRIALRYLRIMLGQFLGAEDRRDWLHATGAEPARILPQATSQIDADLCRQLTMLGYVDARCDAL